VKLVEPEQKVHVPVETQILWTTFIAAGEETVGRDRQVFVAIWTHGIRGASVQLYDMVKPQTIMGIGCCSIGVLEPCSHPCDKAVIAWRRGTSLEELCHSFVLMHRWCREGS